MRMFHKNRKSKAQAAVEYILLLGTVVIIVMVGFQNFLPRVKNASEVFFNASADGIVGDPPRCGNGSCDYGENERTCCLDCDVGGVSSCSCVGVMPDGLTTICAP